MRKMQKVTVVAEVGSNHLGSLDLALEHVWRAAQCGADAVKFQLFRAHLLDSRPEVQDLLRPLEVPRDWLLPLHTEAHKQGMQFIVTPFDLEACSWLRGLVDQVKISAYDLTYLPLIIAASKLDVPVILSTAMATIAEVQMAVNWSNAGLPCTLLHGTAAYPANDPASWNLRAIYTLGKIFPWCGVGLSDHTLGYQAAVMAVTLGAAMIEKHFTLDRENGSPDAVVSFDPPMLGSFIREIRRTEESLGAGSKTGPQPCEMPLYLTCRRTKSKPLRGESRLLVEGNDD